MLNQRRTVTLALWIVVIGVLVARLLKVSPWIILLAGVVATLAFVIIFRKKFARWWVNFANKTQEGGLRIPTEWLSGIVVLTGSWYWLVQPHEFLIALAITITLVILILLSDRISKYASSSSPHFAHIPGAPVRKVSRPQPFYRYVFVGILATSLLFGIVATIMTLAVVPLSLLGIVLIIYFLAFARLRHYAVNCEQINHALADYAPLCALPYDGRLVFHLEMWTPYFLRAETPIIQIVTDEATFNRRVEESSLPIVRPDDLTLDGLKRAMPSSVKAAFYPRNGPTNIDFITARRDILHVFLHHGDGDKPASSTRRSAQYDLLAVAGEAAIDRYAARGISIPREKFVITGRPQVAEILEAEVAIPAQEQVTALYAPTWKGRSERANFSSLPMGAEIVQSLLDRGVRVIFRAHPAGQKHKPHAAVIRQIKDMLKGDRAATGREHVWGADAESRASLAEVANKSDLMIADVSGVVTDYMQSGKPFVMVSMKMEADAFRLQYPSSNSAYIIEASNLDSIAVALDDALGSDTLRAVRLERRKYYLGGYTGEESPAAFVSFIRDVAGVA